MGSKLDAMRAAAKPPKKNPIASALTGVNEQTPLDQAQRIFRRAYLEIQLADWEGVLR